MGEFDTGADSGQLPGRLEPAGPVRQVRDIVMWGRGPALYVAACDSNAAIGDLPADYLRRPPEVTGYSVTKVPLMEVLAVGATPFLLLNTLCGPLDDYGARIVAGIRQAIEESGCDIFVTGSDETNTPTVQTGVGVTVIGITTEADLTLGRARAGDVVVCAGIPRDGLSRPYREGDPGIATLWELAAVARSRLAHEILPVGSRGVRYEVEQLARTASLSPVLVEPNPVDVGVSAGASTCFLVAAPREALASLQGLVNVPVVAVADLFPLP